MPADQINIQARVENVSRRVDEQLTRCLKLADETRVFTSRFKTVDRQNRAYFVDELINDAQGKLVECKIVAGSVATAGDLAPAKLAIIERWTSYAVDLLNRAGRVLDDEQDIWGRNLPTHGLHGK